MHIEAKEGLVYYFIQRFFNIKLPIKNLQSTSTARALSSCAISGDGGDILDTTNLETGTGKCAKGGLSTGTRGLGSVTTGGSKLNMYGSNTFILGLLCGISGGKHGSVRGRLITISLDLHTASYTA